MNTKFCILLILFCNTCYLIAQPSSQGLENLFSNGIYLEDCKSSISWELNSKNEADICGKKVNMKFKKMDLLADSFFIFGKLKAQIHLGRFRKKKSIRIFVLAFLSSDKDKLINYFDTLSGIEKKVQKSRDKSGVFYACSWKISNKRRILLNVADNRHKIAMVRILRK